MTQSREITGREASAAARTEFFMAPRAMALVFAGATFARETVYVPDDESLIDDDMFKPVQPTV